jgi:hypothetical protein
VVRDRGAEVAGGPSSKCKISRPPGELWAGWP